MNFNYSGRVLEYIGESGLLETGETVYCFVQELHQFRVQTRRLILGVNQLIFSNESWDKFKVVQ